jgi:hypothetical protein
MLRALQGDDEVTHFGKSVWIDDDWVVVVEGELDPMRLGEYLARHLESS